MPVAIVWGGQAAAAAAQSIQGGHWYDDGVRQQLRLQLQQQLRQHRRVRRLLVDRDLAAGAVLLLRRREERLRVRHGLLLRGAGEGVQALPHIFA